MSTGTWGWAPRRSNDQVIGVLLQEAEMGGLGIVLVGLQRVQSLWQVQPPGLLMDEFCYYVLLVGRTSSVGSEYQSNVSFNGSWSTSMDGVGAT